MKRLESMTPLMVNELESLTLRVPRKRTIDANILDLFIKTRFNSHPSAPKKEYLRCRLIRGHKRFNRALMQKNLSKSLVEKYQLLKPLAIEILEKLEECFLRHALELGDICKTEKGPKTDGKAKRGSHGLEGENSFNNAFCSLYFSSESIRESYYYYIELLFVNLDPDFLSEFFEISCCREKHDFRCLEKWLVLKKYLNHIMIEDLDLSPFLPTDPQLYFIPNFYKV